MGIFTGAKNQQDINTAFPSSVQAGSCLAQADDGELLPWGNSGACQAVR